MVLFIYSDSNNYDYSEKPGTLRQYCRDEPDINAAK